MTDAEGHRTSIDPAKPGGTPRKPTSSLRRRIRRFDETPDSNASCRRSETSKARSSSTATAWRRSADFRDETRKRPGSGSQTVAWPKKKPQTEENRLAAGVVAEPSSRPCGFLEEEGTFTMK
jgi:hypothetical protein